MNKKRIVVMLFVTLGTLACKRTQSSPNELTLTFLHHVKEEEYASAKLMLWKKGGADSELVADRLQKLHDILIRYEVPKVDKWAITYDTNYIAKTETFTIPLYKGFDAANKLKEANLAIDFEYKGEHIGDLISSFRLSTFYEWY